MEKNWLDTILNTGLSVYETKTAAQTALANANAQATAANAQSNAASADAKKWLPFALIGGGILLLVGLIFAFKK